MINKETAHCWPYDDVYFNAGIECLLKETENNIRPGDFFYVNLCGYNLRQFLQTFPDLSAEHIVLITSKRLLPLAYFLHRYYPEVKAVFESREHLYSIARKLMAPPVLIPSCKSPRSLNLRDFELLLNYLNTGNVDAVHKHSLRAYSTVQAWKKKLAHKFMVRRLMDITLRY